LQRVNTGMPAHCKEFIPFYRHACSMCSFQRINNGTLAHFKELIPACPRIAKNEYQHAFAL
jgi:hypothetical protein